MIGRSVFWVPHLLMLFWAALVASSFPIAALFSDELSASLLVAIRFIVAGAILWVFRPLPLKHTTAAWASYALLGVLLGGNFIIMFIALRYSEPLNLAAIYISLPFFAYLLSIALRMERFRGVRLLLLGAVASAALVILSRADLARIGEIKWGFGESLYLGGCFLAAAYNTLSRYMTDRQWIAADPYATTCLSLIAGGLLLAVPDLLSGELPSFIRQIQLTDLLALGYLTLFTSLLSFWILQLCALKLAPSMLSAYSYQTPMLYLLAELLIGTTVWSNQYSIALLLLLGGFYLLARQSEDIKKEGQKPPFYLNR